MAKATKSVSSTTAAKKATTKQATAKKPAAASKSSRTKATAAKATAARATAARATVAKGNSVKATKPTAADVPSTKLSSVKRAAVKKPKSGVIVSVEAKPARNPGVELTREQARQAAHYALEKKAELVKLLDLREITSMTDFFVIASGDSDKQVKAIAENVIVRMRDEEGVAPWRSEGWDTLQWVIVDFVDFVVHVFQSEARTYYNLERLWADAPTEEITDEPVPAKKRVPKEKKTAESAVAPAEPMIRVIHHS